MRHAPARASIATLPMRRACTLGRMSEPAAGRRPRRTLGRVVAGGVLAWVLVLGGLRALVVQAEQCGDPSVAELRAAAGLAVDWLVRNQRSNGQWMYRYDRDADTELPGYNLP